MEEGRVTQSRKELERGRESETRKSIREREEAEGIGKDSKGTETRTRKRKEGNEHMLGNGARKISLKSSIGHTHK